MPDSDSFLEQIERKMKPYEARGSISELPEQGTDADTIVEEMSSYTREEEKGWKQGLVSGAVYHGGDEMTGFYERVYRIYSQTNPLHPDIWPSLTKYEREIVRMCSSIMHGDELTRGSVTSGGTESILLAMKTYRDYFRKKNGIDRPEVVLPVSAHAAFLKACDYFCIRPRFVGLDGDFRADVEKVKEAVNSNTVAIVGSAPSFPHGAVDPIEDLSEVAMDHGIGMHVDACLGGFIMPWARELGYYSGRFDFELPGVTSISMDTHKYGFAPKGTSVVLYREPELFKEQLYATGKWQGGIYFTPTMAGSRPGYPIAAAWAVMRLMGRRGYREASKRILEAGKRIVEGARSVDGIRVLGKPLWVIAFTSDDRNPHAIMDLMGSRGWMLSGLIDPPAFHIALTMRHVSGEVTGKFLEDLAWASVQAKHAGSTAGMAPVYGTAMSLPAEQVDAFLKDIVEWLYT